VEAGFAAPNRHRFRLVVNVPDLVPTIAERGDISVRVSLAPSFEILGIRPGNAKPVLPLPSSRGEKLD